MGVSVIAGLIDALVTGLPAVVPSNVAVLDSYATSNDTAGDFVMVGVDDPQAETPGQSASSQQVVATMGTTRSRDEQGEVACAAVGLNGAGDMRAARDRAFAITAAVETWLRTADLGVPGLLWIGYGSTTQLLQDLTNEDGAVATVIFRIHFKARL